MNRTARTTPVIVVTPRVPSLPAASVIAGIAARFAIFATVSFLGLSRVPLEPGWKVLLALVLGYVALFLWDTWQVRRTQRGLADEMRFTVWYARAGAIARQRGQKSSRLFSNQPEAFFRELHEDGLSAEEAVEAMRSASCL